LILGSSRVLKVEPDYLERRLGGSFFNAGVDHGRPEDFLALLRWYVDRFGHHPETIVLGLDIAALADKPGPDAQLLTNAQLVRWIPEAVTLEDRCLRWKQLLSWQQTRMSLSSVTRCVGRVGRETPVESFRSDGLLIYHQRERQLSDGTYDFQAALDYNKREYRQLFAGNHSLSPLRCRLLQDFIDTCRRNGVQLLVFLTPQHPELTAYLASTTAYSERRAEVERFVGQQLAAAGYTFCDLSEIDEFDGDPRLFVDGIHPLEANTRKVVDRLLQSALGRIRYVVQ
jgi:hypothetical protein